MVLPSASLLNETVSALTHCTLLFQGQRACQIQLLALDGVYLTQPRTGPYVDHLTLLQVIECMFTCVHVCVSVFTYECVYLRARLYTRVFLCVRIYFRAF